MRVYVGRKGCHGWLTAVSHTLSKAMYKGPCQDMVKSMSVRVRLIMKSVNEQNASCFD